MINTIPKRPARRQAHELRCCAGGGEFGDVPPCHRAQFRSRRGRVGVGEAARTVVEWRGDSALGAGRCRAPRAVARGRRGGAGGVYTMFVTLYRNKNARGIYAHLTLCLLSSSSTLTCRFPSRCMMVRSVAPPPKHPQPTRGTQVYT